MINKIMHIFSFLFEQRHRFVGSIYTHMVIMYRKVCLSFSFDKNEKQAIMKQKNYVYNSLIIGYNTGNKAYSYHVQYMHLPLMMRYLISMN